jgi:hypothetical protein
MASFEQEPHAVSFRRHVEQSTPMFDRCHLRHPAPKLDNIANTHFAGDDSPDHYSSAARDIEQALDCEVNSFPHRSTIADAVRRVRKLARADALRQAPISGSSIAQIALFKLIGAGF